MDFVNIELKSDMLYVNKYLSKIKFRFHSF